MRKFTDNLCAQIFTANFNEVWP